ncbi:hypothetical protein JL722_11881 [Aureococcus anophagefferens]|nr:hypothetical protein JL722_11881 [Aureococcus anophagefferens]
MSASLGSKLSDNLSEGLNRATEVLTFGAYDEFPVQALGLQVFDPESARYAYWEALLAPFIAYAAIVTPTELAFYGDDDGWRCFTDTCGPGTLVLFVANRFVDLYFLADMVVVFNTAVFDPKLNKWVLDRRKIAKYYFRGWFALDVLSILPYDVLNAKSLSSLRLLRTLKVLRLLKLLRVARVGRVLRTWAPRLHMSFKTIAVLRASLLIVVVLHWLACSCRMVLTPCFSRRSSSPTCLEDYMIIVKGRGVTVEYFSALHWAMRALTGDADAPILGVMILAVVAGLLGTIVTSFMIGEVAAILGNSDPASIEYKNTVDTLNAFAAERKFPGGDAAEAPRTIAKEEIGRYITRIPFFRYSICRTLNIKRGAQCNVLPDRNKKVVLVPKQEGEGAGERRSQRASLSGYDCMSFDVEYDDDFLPDFESGVDHERIVCAKGVDATRCVSEVQMMVRELSLHMQCTSFMSHETIVHQGISWNDILYIMVEGVAVVFDQHDQSIASKEVISPKANNVIGKDVCTLLVDGKKRIRDYMARTMTHCLVYSMSADEFTYLLDSAHYQILRRGVRAYGHWMVMRDSVRAAMKAGTLADLVEDKRRGDSSDSSDSESDGGGRCGRDESDATDVSPVTPFGDHFPAGGGDAPGHARSKRHRDRVRKDVRSLGARVGALEAAVQAQTSKLDMILTHLIRGRQKQ